jgi:hypothetical protein
VYSLKTVVGDDAAAVTIDANTGAVKLVASANYEAKSSYAFTVVATNGTLVTEQPVEVSVTDLNDNAPVFTSGGTGTVAENAVAADTVIYTAATTDADGTVGNRGVVYSLKTVVGDDAAAVTIDANTGAVKLLASANYEANSSYAFTVVATNGTLLTKHAVEVSVNNLNEPQTGSIAITGTAALNQVLQVASTLADPDGMGALAYQWFADGVAITGASSASLTLGQSQVGKAITVVVSYIDGSGALVQISPTAPTVKVNAVDPEAEAEVPGIPDADGNTVAGDGNGDGIADAEQDDVASTVVEVTDADGNTQQSYVTLVANSPAGGDTGETTPPPVITSVQQGEAPVDLPEIMSLPLGTLSFTTQASNDVEGDTVSIPETFSLYVDDNLGINGFWVKDAGGVLVNLATEAYGGQIVDEGNGKLRLDFKITEGSVYDADGSQDGVLTVEGSLGQVDLGISGVAPAPTPPAFWF